MVEIKSILCPVDLSETSTRAYEHATTLARWYKASLTVIEMIWVGIPTVRPSSSPLVVPQTMMDEYSTELHHFVKAKTPEGIAVHTVLREGPVVPGILDEARHRAADLIVMGTHGRGGFERFVLGSIATKVVKTATCPVLTVPPHSTTAPTSVPAFRTIVCPIDFSPSSHRASRYALSLAQESGGRLVLLHVFDQPVDRPVPRGHGPDVSAARRDAEEQALRELRAAVPDDAREWCTCQEITRIGRPHEEIVTLATEQQADVIVMGVHGRHSIEHALFGSTTHQVLRHATCPVLTIRPS
jgi:nucleotide-binding universal stress UspA family protein